MRLDADERKRWCPATPVTAAASGCRGGSAWIRLPVRVGGHGGGLWRFPCQRRKEPDGLCGASGRHGRRSLLRALRSPPFVPLRRRRGRGASNTGNADTDDGHSLGPALACGSRCRAGRRAAGGDGGAATEERADRAHDQGIGLGLTGCDADPAARLFCESRADVMGTRAGAEGNVAACRLRRGGDRSARGPGQESRRGPGACGPRRPGQRRCRLRL